MNGTTSCRVVTHGAVVARFVPFDGLQSTAASGGTAATTAPRSTPSAAATRRRGARNPGTTNDNRTSGSESSRAMTARV